jgi:predicted molibdopterin-dependent oxidoreductase YjgC
MSSTNSICVGCSRGCNTEIWVRNNEILRLVPRHNEDVNSYWMCDHGRLNTFKNVNADSRINSPQQRKDGQLNEISWDEAISEAAKNSNHSVKIKLQLLVLLSQLVKIIMSLQSLPKLYLEPVILISFVILILLC